MKAIQVTEFGGPGKLVYTDVEDVVAGKGEVCVRLYARVLIRLMPIH